MGLARVSARVTSSPNWNDLALTQVVVTRKYVSRSHYFLWRIGTYQCDLITSPCALSTGLTSLGMMSSKEEDFSDILARIESKLGQVCDRQEAQHAHALDNEKRLDRLEKRLDCPGSYLGHQPVDTDNATGEYSGRNIGRFVHADAHNPTEDSNQGAVVDSLREFDSIEESLQRIKLPAHLKLADSQTGITKECKAALKVVSRCGRFAETGLKWIGAKCQTSTDEQGLFKLTDEEMQKLYHIFAAQLGFLRGEYANLVVQSTFDTDTAKYFVNLNPINPPSPHNPCRMLG